MLSWTLTRDKSLFYWTNKDVTTASMGVFSNYNLGLYSWLLSSCLHCGHLYMVVDVRTDQWKLHPLGWAMLPEMNSWDQAVSFSFTVKGLPRRARIAVCRNHTALVCLMSRYQNDITGALFLFAIISLVFCGEGSWEIFHFAIHLQGGIDTHSRGAGE